MNKTTIQKELLYLGIKPSLKGFDYIATAIEEYETGLKITYLYYKIAKAYKTESTRVERNIRHAKSEILKNRIPEIKTKLIQRYGIEANISENMSNGEFIALMKFAINELENICNKSYLQRG